jgi:hypothetical protein
MSETTRSTFYFLGLFLGSISHPNDTLRTPNNAFCKPSMPIGGRILPNFIWRSKILENLYLTSNEFFLPNQHARINFDRSETEKHPSDCQKAGQGKARLRYSGLRLP